jgi:hypothetical protein
MNNDITPLDSEVVFRHLESQDLKYVVLVILIRCRTQGGELTQLKRHLLEPLKGPTTKAPSSSRPSCVAGANQSATRADEGEAVSVSG